ncbi:peptidylprolyl isomerase [Candidatus Pacearchaeota archaeon]|nr:peptidylprolyl isomerase [Candidatus Pacearchaeota archaeon]
MKIKDKDNEKYLIFQASVLKKMNIKNKDFLEIEYTGKIKEDNIIFDTTDEKLAKDNNLSDQNISYGPVIICLGEGQILKGLEEELIDKEAGKEYTIELDAEKGFGKKDPKLIQLIPTSKFKQQKITPMPGLQLNIDGVMGVIKTVSGGRTMVDFNHPLGGKDIAYEIKINKIVTDDQEKVQGYIQISLGIKDFDVKIENDIAKVNFKKEIPNEVSERLSAKIKELIPNVKNVEFTIGEEKNK